MEMSCQMVNTISFWVQNLTLIELVIYVVKTWEMASASRNSVKISENTLNEMKSARDAESAPHVIVYFEMPTLSAPYFVYIVIKNIGKNMATKIVINFEPELNSRVIEPFRKVVPANGIASLAPGVEIKTIIGDWKEVKGSGDGKYKINIVYYGGMSEKPRSSSYILDINVFNGIVEKI